MHNHTKNILITGASSGIGAALATLYAKEGVFIALSGRDEERLKDIAQKCRKKGAQVQQKIVDVIDKQAMCEWIEAIDDERPLDLVIANAGISGGTGGGGESLTQVRKIFAINITGVFNTVEPALARMESRGRGQIALMSSLASFSGWPGAPAYSASKGAVRMYGEAIRLGMAQKGIKINVICPGFIKTPMTDVNGYKMPFLMDVDKAARVIARGIERDKGRIAFPWQSFWLAGFVGLLPYWLSSRIFSGLPEKPQC